MKNRINYLFEKKNKEILSIFFTAGFPTLNDTVTIAIALEKAGADIIEIGIPFSDPVADGPVIQESNKIALDNGMTVKLLLQQAKEIRRHVQIPILLMGYLNPVYQYGVERFCRDASDSGVDGLILPDLPLDEFEKDFKKPFEENNIASVFLISPTTSEDRIKKIDKLSTGFIYAVSSSSTTGAKKEFSPEQETYFKKLQGLKLKNRFLIGFGISNQQTFIKACTYASGGIVGSAFISLLKSAKDLDTEVVNFVKTIK
ncbi:MAG: tryptophan synthase subunit alpha [Bacteroidetes bacterium]|nr:tryptophan synthase subunit alpha [Bacteroidota bacterium]